MRKTLAFVSALMIIVGGGAWAQDAPGAHISRAVIEGMFAKLQAAPGFDPKGNLRWSYYFVGLDKGKLERASDLLVARGYTLVGITPLEKGFPDAPDIWQLHVEKVEHQTVDTLLARDEVLYAFAAKQGLERYDGVTVGPAK